MMAPNQLTTDTPHHLTHRFVDQLLVTAIAAHVLSCIIYGTDRNNFCLSISNLTFSCSTRLTSTLEGRCGTITQSLSRPYRGLAKERWNEHKVHNPTHDLDLLPPSLPIKAVTPASGASAG